MIQAFDSETLNDFARLLARSDPRDLPRRGHVYRYEGDPNRRATRLPGILMGWLQRRYLEIDVEEPVAATTRTSRRYGRPVNPGLTLLRPTGTG